MEKAKGFSFEDFSIEIGDFEVTKKKNYHYSFWHCTEGGSIDQRPLIYKGVIYFGSFNHNLYALNAQTGKEIWKFKAQDRIGLCSPILYRNSVIIGSYDHNVYRIDADTGKLIWKFPTFGEIASSGAIHNGICYFTCRDQFLYAIKCNNGSLVWKYKTFEPNVSVPTVHGEKVFFGSSDRNLYCLNNRNGNLIWKFQAEEEIVNVTPFIVHKNAIYFGTLGNFLYAVDINVGKKIWRFPTGEYGMTRGQVLYKNMLVQPTNDGILYAIRPDGKLVWKYKKRHPLGAVATDGEKLYVGCEDFYLYCLNHEGKELWKFRTEGPIWQPGTIWNGVVFFGSYDCNLYALDALKGNLIWKFRCLGSVSTYPEIKSFFEASVKIPKIKAEEGKKKSYELNLSEEDEEGVSAYKSRITYQVSTQYREKGKYQIDSDEEAF